MRINRQDTNGVKPLLQVGELGYDNWSGGGDVGRVYVGNGASNIALAKKSEVDTKVVANVDITAGTATKVTYDAKGLVTSGTNPTTLSGYGITDADTSAQVTTKINNAVAALVDASPATLDTLNELAAALGDDPNFATTTANNIAAKVAKVTSTDNAIVRFDGTTGAVQNSGVIIDDNSNVGINNNAPLQKLHVGGSIIAGDATYASVNSFIGAILNNNSTAPSLDIRRWQGGGTTHAVIKIAGNTLGEIIFYRDIKSTNTEATTEKMKLDANGNLLVGTSVSNGLDKVQIEGSFSSKAVKDFTGIDLNTLKTRTEVCSVTNSCTNLPIAETGFLEVFMFDSNSQWVMQRFTCIGYPNTSNQGRTYVRNWMWDNIWSAWVEK